MLRLFTKSNGGSRPSVQILSLILLGTANPFLVVSLSTDLAGAWLIVLSLDHLETVSFQNAIFQVSGSGDVMESLYSVTPQYASDQTAIKLRSSNARRCSQLEGNAPRHT
ncbi:hypothetical protein EDB19DRAFT_435612 [Suillus lakei]|nr:hypothetical protein EDB19DRAFT_435612 [Suillus lakei]